MHQTSRVDTSIYRSLVTGYPDDGPPGGWAAAVARAVVARATISGAWGTSPRIDRWSSRPSPTTLTKRAATSSGMAGATRPADR
jgi:hypothetical protein